MFLTRRTVSCHGSAETKRRPRMRGTQTGHLAGYRARCRKAPRCGWLPLTAARDAEPARSHRAFQRQWNDERSLPPAERDVSLECSLPQVLLRSKGRLGVQVNRLVVLVGRNARLRRARAIKSCPAPFRSPIRSSVASTRRRSHLLRWFEGSSSSSSPSSSISSQGASSAGSSQRTCPPAWSPTLYEWRFSSTSGRRRRTGPPLRLENGSVTAVTWSAAYRPSG